MSDSVRPHRRQPTRLLCLWDSPGKNTGMGCHSLLHPKGIILGNSVQCFCRSSFLWWKLLIYPMAYFRQVRPTDYIHQGVWVKCRFLWSTQIFRIKISQTGFRNLHFNKHPCNFSVHFSSVAQSCPTLCNPMNRSTPGFPVHHQLPEFTQTHVHWVSDAIQPSHPLSSPSPPPSIFLCIMVFSNKSVLGISWPKYWSFSFSICPSNEYQDWFPLGWTGWISL